MLSVPAITPVTMMSVPVVVVVPLTPGMVLCGGVLRTAVPSKYFHVLVSVEGDSQEDAVSLFSSSSHSLYGGCCEEKLKILR